MSLYHLCLSNFQFQSILTQKIFFAKLFCLKMGWNWKLYKQRGYRDQHLFYKFLLIMIKIFDFIIASAQKYQSFDKNPIGATALDFMDPRFIIYMTSAFQRYATLFWGIFWLDSTPIKLWALCRSINILTRSKCFIFLVLFSVKFIYNWLLAIEYKK